MDRDTQFQGFAKALMSELPEPPTDDSLLCIAHAEWREEVSGIIARRVYDFAFHTLSYTTESMARMFTDEAIEAIPDLTELPKEDKQDEPS